MPDLRERLIDSVSSITVNMEKRGGGIQDIELVDRTSEIDHYYQLKVSFETVDNLLYVHL